jgi:hypothetical protein
MGFFLFVLALVWIVFGASLTIYTKETRQALLGWFPTEVIRQFAVPAMVVGGLLMLGAFFSGDKFWWPFLLGLLALAKGAYILKSPPEKLSALMGWWYSESGASEETVRLAGLLTLLLGGALLASLL